MWGEKEISSGISSNSLELDGTLTLFNSTSLFTGAQVNGEGNITLEEGSVLDLRRALAVFISPSLFMKENASILVEVSRFPLTLHQQEESDVWSGRMILSSSSDLEEGEIYTVASTKTTLLFDVYWKGYIFDVYFNSSGIFLVFEGNPIPSCFLHFLF